MPSSASRFSWSGMPFALFERRARRATNSDTVPTDMAELQVFLTSKVRKINVHRGMLNLPPWQVPDDISLLQLVCKVWWGSGLEIPDLKLVDGKYKIDYEAMERDRETQEILSNTSLIAMSTMKEHVIAEVKQAEADRKARVWRSNSSMLMGFRSRKRKSRER